MFTLPKIPVFILPSLSFLLFSCSDKVIDENNYGAYFGGQIINPKSSYILLCKDNKVLDTLKLDQENRFSKKFDFLTPGMYIIKHSNNNKYVYFDKNDSLYLRINTNDFEHASSFYGKGKDKNNFLLEMFASNIDNKNNLNFHYNKSYNRFKKSSDSLKDARTAFYLRRKTEIGWNLEFDMYAKALIDYEYYARLEIYPFAHYEYTHKNIQDSLPENYYDFRKKIDFNNEKLSEFRPFTKYLATMLNSIIAKKEMKNDFEINISKLKIVDSLITNKKVKNKVLNNIAFVYLLEDQNINNNKAFLNKYFEISTDSTQQNEILKISKSIKHLSNNRTLPNVELIDVNGNKVELNKNISKKTIVFFWTKNAINQYYSSHKKVDELLKKHPNYSFVSINIDSDKENWKRFVNYQNNTNTIELQATDFSQLKDLWIVTRLNRAILLNSDGTIKDAFVNIFEDELLQKM